MSFIIFIQIFFACLIGAMLPGPSMVMVVNNAIFKNRYHGILTSIGHGIGISIYAVFAVIGISLIIETNIIIFNSVKLISVFFLIFMGLKTIFNNSSINFDQGEFNGKLFLFSGFFIFLNPKIFMVYRNLYNLCLKK